MAAQSSKSIQTQPEPEVRLDKLQPDHPDARPDEQKEPPPLPHPQQPQPQDPAQQQLNGDRPAPSATVASSSSPPSNNITDLIPPNNSTAATNDSKHDSPTASGPVDAPGSGQVKAPVATVATTSTTLPPIQVPTQQIDSNHGGQNGTRNSGDRPLSHSPPMSTSQAPPDGLPRQGQTGYPNAAPSPYHVSHPGAPYAYPAQVQPHHDPYRPPPTTVSSSIPLPSMRTFDHQQQPPQQPGPPPHGYNMGVPMGQHMGGPMAGQMGMPAPGGMPPGQVALSYYPNPLPPNAYTMQYDVNGQRYAMLPEVDPRIILANRQKKKWVRQEIKRRTKTGCLTCRKRRIKCDEAHPKCNNCHKSKRECLGYDPIFKSQPTPQTNPPAPVRIQPAPSPTNNTTPSATPSLVSPPAATATSPVPFSAATVPNNYAPAVDPSPASATNYPTRIDPSLRGIDPAPRGYEPAPQPRAPEAASRTVEPAHPGVDPQYRSTDPSFRSVEQPVPPRRNTGEQQQPQQPQHPPRPRGGAAPAQLSSPLSEDTVNEIIRLYYEIYEPGLNLFFETQWYHFKNENQPGAQNPLSILRLNKRTMDTFASFLTAVRGVKTTEPADMTYPGHLETCLTLELARLSYAAAAFTPPRPTSVSLPPEDDITEARYRLQVFESLLAGENLLSNSLTPPPQPSATSGPNEIRVRELEFWYSLAQYLLRDHSSPSERHIGARQQCLSRMRSVLDGRENRDVLYSIAVLREYTMQWDAADTEQTAPAHLDEKDPRSRLAVATRFIQDEAIKIGTTNVVRRFADLAYRAYVRPGGNVRRG
ncbi:hypothetical protein GE09DRAFT_1194821 [Coniochaeta sp. 2T2.1]|nr:hypothetical protein GE09DRAFT_1194821 [Coniochaeta sp. 2T2.1]